MDQRFILATEKKNISRNNTFRFDSFNMRYSTRNFSLLTRSKTRENSGVLRVFKGSAGLRVNCSSVRGGTCLMKKYLKTEKLLKRPSNSASSQQKAVVIYNFIYTFHNFINRNCLRILCCSEGRNMLIVLFLLPSSDRIIYCMLSKQLARFLQFLT